MMAFILSWYLAQFGIDTMLRFLYGVALLAVVVIMFIARDNTEKVAVAVGTIDKFVEKQTKAKEPSDDIINTVADKVLEWLIKNFESTPTGEHAIDEKPPTTDDSGKAEKEVW